MQKIKKLTEFGKHSWVKYVPQATLAVNLYYNRAIGTSPFVFSRGRPSELDIDKELLQPRIKVSLKDSKVRRNAISYKYKKEIIKGKILNRKSFRPGDKVLIFRQSQNKLDADWFPVYTVIEKLSDDAYSVRRNKKLIRVNKCHLRLE
ncbi:hypothetical protein NGRA_3061 [Nosema granulosis]|uniref:Uncharacterized protein n=1 Tax=Nosema granulosis TaxID=83296 RepID=A0A9P6GY53_9MICR|nr:hypothetical protein NGRA_3061 [Nosema granulosis]